MKVLFDSSVLVAAMVETHPHHEVALNTLSRFKNKKSQFHVSAHSLAELYSTLTSLPLSPRISPEIALRLIKENIEERANLISLTSKEYLGFLEEAKRLQLTGGIIYDALIAACAKKAKVDKLITLNLKHFLRVWPNDAQKIQVPSL